MLLYFIIQLNCLCYYRSATLKDQIQKLIVTLIADKLIVADAINHDRHHISNSLQIYHYH